MQPIRVVVYGALGRMGRQVVNALFQEPTTILVGAIDLEVSQDSILLPNGSASIPLGSDLEQILDSCRPQVIVDFTIAQATMPAVRAASQRRINLVIGTTGLSSDELDEIDCLAKANQIGAVVAPNFALGAVLMIHLAKIAAKYLDHAEIIELHHDRKADAPSGTALSTAKAMLAARKQPFATPQDQAKGFRSRGETHEGINIHSVRLPGLLAHQEVILGTSGQTLRIRHDTINRECYMPGVILAVKEVAKHRGLVFGLDTLLDL